MSNDSLTNHVPITPIDVPSLNDAGYAAGLDDAFEKINDNFSILANHEFIKGDNGKSVEIKPIKFFNDDNSLTIYGQKFQECIMSIAGVDHPDSIPTITEGDVTLSVWDNFTKDTAGEFLMVYAIDKVMQTSTPVSSLYYVFLDGRFANTTVGKVDPAKYDGIEDLSCIIIYDKDIPTSIGGTGGFKAMQNAFPTMYYERGLGLCWKVNGNTTGIPVQGIPGVDGKDSVVNIVKCQSVTNNNRVISGEVVGIYESFDGYVPIAQIESISDYAGTSALVLTSDNENNGSNFYFGSLKLEGEKLIAVCNQETAINYGIEEESIINAMKNIDILNNGSENASSGIKGLFIPMRNEISGNQPVHLLSATSITNTEGQASDLKSDVVFTPVDDINSLRIDNDNHLNVEKYLYLKVDKSFNILRDNLFATLPAYEYVLKYKLTSFIKNICDPNDATRLNRYFDTYNENTVTGGSRFFSVNGVYADGEIVTLSDGNTMYYSSETINDVINNASDVVAVKSADLIEGNLMSMPTEFSQRLLDEDNGIYRWELCNEKADYDVDELLAYEGDSYDFPKPFNVIYTTSVTPNVTTDIMWFNGFETIDDPNAHYGIDNDNVNGKNVVEQRYYIYGWNSGTNGSMFQFIKFVPIYDTDFSVNDDTTLNINYNVNITGDSNEPTKNLTVHGSVNCDNINVYRLTATGEIKNIYTKDTIVGDKGLKLGLYNENGTTDHHVKISDGGVISTDRGLTTKYISCYNPEKNPDEFNSIEEYTIKSDNLKARQTQTNELFVNNASNVRRVFIGDNGDNLNDLEQYSVELHTFTNIDIERDDNIALTKTKDNVLQPVLRSNMPVLQNDHSNIIVTNQDKGGVDLPYNGISTNADTKPSHEAGTGVSNVSYIWDTKFEKVKNFNINRLSLNTTVPEKVKGGYGLTYQNFNVRSATLESSGGWADNYDVTSSKSPINDYMYKIELHRSDENETFNRSSNLSIEFNNNFMTWLGIYGKNENGRWPVMWKDSYMNLSLYYGISGESELYSDPTITKHFTIEYTANSVSNDNGFEWYGYDANTNASLAGNYGGMWRYYPYYFRPSKMELKTSSNNFKKIADAFDAGKTVTLYIAAKFRLYASGQEGVFGNQRSVVAGVYASRPVALSTKYASTSSTLRLETNLNPSRATDGSKTISVNYYINRKSSNNSVNSTIVCEDGIVMRSGDYTFGLGYCDTVVNHGLAGYNKTTNDPHWRVGDDQYTSGPVLFYHETSSDYYLSNGAPKGTKGVTDKGYATRTNAIPLKYLFNFLKSQHGNWTYGV